MSRHVTFTSGARFLVAAALTIALAGFTSAEQQEDLLTLLKTGHRSTRESIRTFSASMLVENESPEKKRVTTVKATYWRTPRAVRIHEVYPDGRKEETLQTPSERRQVGKFLAPDGKRFRHTAVRGSPSKDRIQGDVWATMLLDFPNGTGGGCDLDRFLEIATKPPTVKRERLDNHDCLHLVAHYSDGQLGDVQVDAWFDPEVNYLVRKRVLSWAKVRSETHIRNFHSVGGFSFPDVCEGVMITPDRKLGPAHASLSDIRINSPIPEKTFQLDVPSGTILFDRFENTYYPVNSGWVRTGPSVAMPSPRSLAPQSDGTAPPFTEQSATETPARVNWVLWIALGVLATAGGIWGYRKYGRASRQMA